MYRLNTFFSKCHKSLPLVMASICGHYMYEHIRHNDTITTKSERNFTFKPLITLRNAGLMDTDVAAKMRQIHEQTKASVVMVVSGLGAATGFVVDRAGLIITNAHVVVDQPYVNVELQDQRLSDELFKGDTSGTMIGMITGQVVYADPECDLALVRVFVREGAFPALPLSSRALTALTVGEPVLLHGSPGMHDVLSVGQVLGVDRPSIHTQVGHQRGPPGAYKNDAPFVQHSAPMIVGFSGGPLIDGDGHVIGVHFSGIDLVGCAIPANTVIKFLEEGKNRDIMAVKEEYRMFDKRCLGVVLEQKAGTFKVIYGAVKPKLVATGALRVNDIIRAIDGTPVTTFSQLKSLIANRELTIAITRGGDDIEVMVTPHADINFFKCSVV